MVRFCFGDVNVANQPNSVTPGIELSPATAAGFLFLDRRARHRPIRAEDTAIARLRTQNRVAALALVEVLTSRGRHDFHCLMPAFWAGQRAFKLHGHQCFPVGFTVAGKPASLMALAMAPSVVRSES